MFYSAGATDRRVLRALSLLAALAVANTACGTDNGGSSAAQTTITTAAPTTTATSSTTSTEAAPLPATDADWCPSADAVAEVVGHDVVQSINAGGSGSFDFSYSFEGCSYDRDDNRYSITRATVDSDGNASSFDLLAEGAQTDVTTSGFTPIEGLGDDAYLDGQTVVARTGQTMVFIEVDHPDGEDTADQRDALAADLMDIDLSDEEVPCTAPAPAVENVFGPGAEARSGGGGLSIEEVDIAYDSCTFQLGDGTQVIVSVADDRSWDDWVDAKKSSSFTVAYNASSIGEYAAFDNGEELLVDESDQPLRITAEGPELSKDDAMDLRMNLAELVLAG